MGFTMCIFTFKGLCKVQKEFTDYLQTVKIIEIIKNYKCKFTLIELVLLCTLQVILIFLVKHF